MSGTRSTLSTSDAHCLELDVEACELRPCGEPSRSRAPYVAHLLLVDHLERMPEGITALLLHLDDQDAAPPSQHEIELVAADARIRREQPVSTEAVVAEGDSLAPVHAAS